MKSRALLLTALMLALALGPLTACTPRPKTALKVLYAGSLIIPFDTLEKVYEAQHPDVDVQAEGHGSIQVIRHVTEIHDLVDVAITADYALIPMLMYPSLVPDTGQPYASWYCKFATNELVLAYRPESRYADEINAENWPEILLRPGVRLGLSDPRFDAAGYRTLMILQMAQAQFNQPTLFEQLVTNSFTFPIRARTEGATTVIRVPEIVETKENSPILVRAYSIQIIALLQAGEVDYTFAYDSVAQQHGLKIIRLPSSLNLGSEAHNEEYAKVQVSLEFQRFASVKPVFNGEAIAYGLTIPSNAPHPEAAEAFSAFLLGPEGQKILQDNYNPVINPPQADHWDALPARIQPLCVPMP
jgi:molybdate/tungstate transport system substrate-binding protein